MFMAENGSTNKMIPVMGLKDLRLKRKLSQERVASEIGISVPYLSRLERGKREISGKLIKRFTEFYQCDTNELFTPDSPGAPSSRPYRNITVIGHVQAGDWREAVEWDDDSRYPISAPNTDKITQNSFGLEVRGASMNREYDEGDVLICVPIIEYHRDIESGDFVICEHTAADGLVEATVKEFQREVDGTVWLWPRSKDPAHQQPIQVPWPPNPLHITDETYRISAVVVGGYKSR
jgi:transcriptional regulator with XRE-family HTH domain